MEEPVSPGFSKPRFQPVPEAADPLATATATATATGATTSPQPHSSPAKVNSSILPAPKALSRAGVPGRKRVFKVIIIGDAGVGKTCLSFRFCNGRFPERTEATIGVDFRERCVEIEGEVLRIQLWDTAGQERFRQSMVAHYYRNVSAVVFVYDLGRPESFAHLEHWIKEARSHVPPSDSLPMILVGNKCDVPPSPNAPRVPTGDAQKFADGHDMPLFETSAKADSQADHVESIFMTLVHKLKEAKGMHVQTSRERGVEKESKILRAEDLRRERTEDVEEPGWCC